MQATDTTGLFLVYSSSAGSGKTYTLVKHYLKLTIKNPASYRNVLAITFTKKASAEMKERVIQYLDIISRDDISMLTEKEQFAKSDYEAFLENQTGLSVYQIRINAAMLLKSILHGYGEFSITTIDSFMHRMIRSFSFDLYLPFNFEIETDYRKIIQQALQVLLSRVGKDEEVTNLLVDYVQSSVDEENSWNIVRGLQEDASELEKEMSSQIIEALKNLDINTFLDIIRKARKKLKSFEARIAELGKGAMEILNKNGIKETDLYYGKSGIYSLFLKASMGDYQNININNSYYRASIDEGKWIGTKASAQSKSIIQELSVQLAPIAQEIIGALETTMHENLFLNLALKRLYSVALLNELKKTVEEIKEQNGIIAIADFNKIISSIILEQPVPFIFERSASRYQHVLIDEFQDTSVLQWENLMALVDNALAQNHFSMVVGDAKQAIYRFRGGEARQLLEIDKPRPGQDNPFVLDRIRTLSLHLKKESLNTNFRSDKVIVDFNNLFFEAFVKTQTNRLAQTYQDVFQNPKSNQENGYVEVRFLENPEKLTSLDYKELQLSELYMMVQDCIDQGFSFKDIAILVRSNTLGSLISRYFLEHDEKIPVVSPDSISLGNDPKINFLYEFLKVLKNDKDYPALAAVMNFLNKDGNISAIPRFQDYMELLAENGDIEKGNPSKKNALLIFFWEWMEESFRVNKSQLLALPLYEMCEEIIRVFSLVSTPDPFVIGFLDAVNDFVSSRFGGLNDFVEFWEKERFAKSVILPEGYDAVQVMTIHKSKGLQFPIVIIPTNGMDLKQLWKTKFWIQSPKEIESLPAALFRVEKGLEKTDYSDAYQEQWLNALEDLWNMIYVAFTRAESQLYILGRMPNQSDKKDVSPVEATLDKFLVWFLSENQLLNEERNMVSFGAKRVKKVKADEEKNDDKEQTSDSKKSSGGLFTYFVAEDWKTRLKVSIPDMDLHSENTIERVYGETIHNLFSLCNTVEDIRSKVISFLRNSDQNPIVHTASVKLADSIEALLNSGNLSSFYKKGLRAMNEASIMDAEGQVLRPDRLVFLGDKVWVIELKTGNFMPSHKKQVAAYKAALGQMGFPNVGIALVYLKNAEIIEL